MREFQFGIENGGVGMFECKNLIKMYPNQQYEAVLCFVCLAGLTTTYMYMEPCLLHVSGFGISETYSCISVCGSYLKKKPSHWITRVFLDANESRNFMQRSQQVTQSIIYRGVGL